MKIAFVALSGLRACDPELIKLGLTFPGVIERGVQVAQLPSLGLLTLAGMTPAPHEVSYFEVGDLKTMDTLPGPFDLVAISGLTAQMLDGYALADRFRAAGSQVVLGGLHVTALPQEAHQHADAVVVGEGEPVWPTILAHAATRTLQPIYDARQTPFEFSPHVMPAYHLLDMARYNRMTVQTSRGCPWRCSFCASSITLVPRYKQKPADQVLAQVDRVMELMPRPFVELADDNSFVNKTYWRNLLPQLAERRLRWFTETDISVGDDDTFLEELAKAGCVEVLIGLESPVTTRLAGLEMNTDWKRKRNPRALANVRRIQEHGIRVNACFILGMDGQTQEDYGAIASFLDEARPWDVQLTLLTPFPGTPLYQSLKDQQRLTHDREWNRYTLFDLNHATTPMPPDEVRRAFRTLVAETYTDAAVRRRRRGFVGRRQPPRRRKPVKPATAAPPKPNRLNIVQSDRGTVGTVR